MRGAVGQFNTMSHACHAARANVGNVRTAMLGYVALIRARGHAMVLGLFSLSAYTTLHVVISLIAIAAGLVVLYGFLAGKRLDGWAFVFLLFTILTSLTGFGFPFDKLLPSHIVGIISLVVLLLAVLALYMFRLGGPWRWIYVVTAMVAFWFNVFVLIAQGFGKVAALKALAPTQSEPPFLIAQLVVLAVFVVLTIMAARKFHPPAMT